jgi:hypothetical protein
VGNTAGWPESPATGLETRSQPKTRPAVKTPQNRLLERLMGDGLPQYHDLIKIESLFYKKVFEIHERTPFLGDGRSEL